MNVRDTALEQAVRSREKAQQSVDWQADMVKKEEGFLHDQRVELEERERALKAAKYIEALLLDTM